jgi:hypothetical protein
MCLRPLLALAVMLTLLLPGAAGAGGSPIGFVSLPSEGTLAVVELPGGASIAHVDVPGHPTSVAASVNGRRVLVGSADAGTVTELDGVGVRVLRIFRGFTQPVAVAFDHEAPVGIVTPYYGLVLEATGMLDVLDLGSGRIVARLAVGAHPKRFVVEGTTAWIAHRGNGRLTRVNLATPAKPRLLASVNAGAPVAALAADPELRSVFVAFARSGRIVRFVDIGAHARRSYRRAVTTAALVGLALAPNALLVAAEPDGALHLLREQSGRQLSRLQLPTGVEAIDVYGGWLVAILPRSLRLVAVPDGSMRATVPFHNRIGAFAWGVI